MTIIGASINLGLLKQMKPDVDAQLLSVEGQVFPESWRYPIAGWFIVEHPIEMDDLEVALLYFRKPLNTIEL